MPQLPRGSSRPLTEGLEQDLVNSGGTERFHYSREVCFFFPPLPFHGLVLQKTAQNALCGQLKLTNHIRLKSSSIKLSWITPCDSPLRIDKSTASRKKKKNIHSFERESELHNMTCSEGRMRSGMTLENKRSYNDNIIKKKGDCFDWRTRRRTGLLLLKTKKTALNYKKTRQDLGDEQVWSCVFCVSCSAFALFMDNIIILRSRGGRKIKKI